VGNFSRARASDHFSGLRTEPREGTAPRIPREGFALDLPPFEKGGRKLQNETLARLRAARLSAVTRPRALLIAFPHAREFNKSIVVISSERHFAPVARIESFPFVG